jgi:hypothetical protein
MWVVGIKEFCKTASYTDSVVQTAYTLEKTETTVHNAKMYRLQQNFFNHKKVTGLF